MKEFGVVGLAQGVEVFVEEGFFEEEGDEGDGGGDQDGYGQDADGVVDGVVGSVGGAGEEEVVLVAHVGEDRHGGLDVLAVIGGGEEIEGREGQA